MATGPDMDAGGFFRSLYDFSFTSLVTTKIIRFVYALMVILFTFVAVIALIGSLASGNSRGIVFGIIIIPLGYFIYLTMARIWMEFLIVVFRIGDDIHAMRDGGGGLAPGGRPAQGGGPTWGGPGPQPPAPGGGNAWGPSPQSPPQGGGPTWGGPGPQNPPGTPT